MLSVPEAMTSGTHPSHTVSAPLPMHARISAATFNSSPGNTRRPIRHMSLLSDKQLGLWDARMSVPRLPAGAPVEEELPSTFSEVKASFNVFFGNPELVKAIFCMVLLGVGTLMSPVAPLVIQELKSQYWQRNMTSYSAILNLVNGLLGMVSGGLIGRLGDRWSRKGVMVVTGVIGFLPNMSLLVFGRNELGLDVCAVLGALSGVICMTASGCPQGYALVSEVMPAEDQEVGFGIAFMVLIVTAGAFMGAAYGLSGLFKDDSQKYVAVLIFNAVTNVLYFVVLAWVKIPKPVLQDEVAPEISTHQSQAQELEAAGPIQNGAAALDVSVQIAEEPEDVENGRSESKRPSFFDVGRRRSSVMSVGDGLRAAGRGFHTEARLAVFCPDLSEDDGARSSDDDLESVSDEGSDHESDAGKPKLGDGLMGTLISPLKLMCGNAPIRILCIMFALVSVPEVTLQDVSTQYYFGVFDLIGTAGAANEQQVIQILFAFPGFVLLVPGFYIAGVLGKNHGSLCVLRWVIPVTAVLLLLPVLMLPFAIGPNGGHRLWLVALVGVGVPFAMVVFTPLQSLITKVAPPGQLGEAMGAVGACKQIAAIVGNLLVTFGSGALVRTSLPNPLWVFFPFASACSLLAFLVSFCFRPAESEGSSPRTPDRTEVPPSEENQ